MQERAASLRLRASIVGASARFQTVAALLLVDARRANLLLVGPLQSEESAGALQSVSFHNAHTIDDIVFQAAQLSLRRRGSSLVLELQIGAPIFFCGFTHLSSRSADSTRNSACLQTLLEGAVLVDSR